jgi:hypothetical protein
MLKRGKFCQNVKKVKSRFQTGDQKFHKLDLDGWVWVREKPDFRDCLALLEG